jgi:hypothetical protein
MSLIGSLFTVVAIYQFQITGAYAAVYVTGVVTAVGLWRTLYRVARTEMDRTADGKVRMDRSGEEGQRVHADGE